MFKMMGRMVVGVVLASLSAACVVADADADAGSVEMDEETGSVAQSITTTTTTWTPVSSNILGIARAANTNKVYAWYSNGTVCRGTVVEGPQDLCSDATYGFTASAYPLNTIVAVDAKYSALETYVWYNDSSVSWGTSDDLTYYHDKVSFTRPFHPLGGMFSMSELIDVYCNVDDICFYYWKSGGKVYVTYGTTHHGYYYHPAQEVTVSTTDGDILGISYTKSAAFGNAGMIEAWYASGRLKWAWSPRDLSF